MNFDAMAYPDIFVIDGVEYKGRRESGKKKVTIPYTQEPNINIGDLIIQKSGKSNISLKILDMSFLEDGSLKVGTKHPHMLTLMIDNITSGEHLPKSSTNTFNIGNVSGSQVQIGESNHLIVNVSITELVEKVAASNDKEAKSTLKNLLENSTVAGIVGAGASALFGLL
jgi:hypothetical protein